MIYACALLLENVLAADTKVTSSDPIIIQQCALVIGLCWIMVPIVALIIVNRMAQ